MHSLHALKSETKLKSPKARVQLFALKQILFIRSAK